MKISELLNETWLHDNDPFFRRAEHSPKTGLAVQRKPGKLIARASNREFERDPISTKTHKPIDHKKLNHGRSTVHVSGKIQPQFDSDGGITEQGVAEEQLSELSPQTLASYKRKAGAQASELDKRAFHKDTEPEQAKRDIAKANKRFSGIVRATKKEFGK